MDHLGLLLSVPRNLEIVIFALTMVGMPFKDKNCVTNKCNEGMNMKIKK